MYCVREWFWGNSYPFIPEPGQNYKFVDEYVYEKRFRLTVLRNKLDAALKKAERAYDFYQKGRHIAARRIWRSMFGSMFPSPEPQPAKPVLVPPKQMPALTLRDAVSIQPTPTAGLLDGLYRNALLDSLSNSPPKLSDIKASDINRNALIDALANPKPKLSDIPRSDTVTKTLADLLSGSYDPFKKY